MKMFCTVGHLHKLLPRQIVLAFPSSSHSGKALTDPSESEEGECDSLKQLNAMSAHSFPQVCSLWLKLGKGAQMCLEPTKAFMLSLLGGQHL